MISGRQKYRDLDGVVYEEVDTASKPAPKIQPEYALNQLRYEAPEPLHLERLIVEPAKQTRP